jgi:hypothetical protein
MHFFGIEFFGDCGVVGHICKEDRHQLALPLYRASVIEDLIGQVFGGIRLGLIVVDRGAFLTLSEIITACVTKFAFSPDSRFTLRADEFEFMTTFTAEPGPFTIFKLALRAFHF